MVFITRSDYLLKKYLDNEIEFLINAFVENGHNIEVLEKAAKNI